MAFALTAAEFRSSSFQNPSYKRGAQEVVLTITGAATDTDLDIGDASGTFWTAAQADATYGTMAAEVLTKLQAAVAGTSYLRRWECPELQAGAYAQVKSSPAANQYSTDIGTYGVNITLHSGDAPTSYHVILVYEMAAGQFPVTAAYNL
jgi:hypothetical protein